MRKLRWGLLFIAMCVLAPASMAWPTLTFNFDGQKQQKKDLKAKATAHSVVLTWTQGVVPVGSTCTGGGSTAVTGNAVFRGTTSGGEGTTAYATLTTPATTYTDTGVAAGASYWYTVTATNCNGPSAQSAEVGPELIPNPLVPNAPGGLTATPQ